MKSSVFHKKYQILSDRFQRPLLLSRGWTFWISPKLETFHQTHRSAARTARRLCVQAGSQPQLRWERGNDLWPPSSHTWHKGCSSGTEVSQWTRAAGKQGSIGHNRTSDLNRKQSQPEETNTKAVKEFPPASATEPEMLLAKIFASQSYRSLWLVNLSVSSRCSALLTGQ